MDDVFKVLKGKALSENRRHFPTHFMKLGAKSVRCYKEKEKHRPISLKKICVTKSLTKW